MYLQFKFHLNTFLNQYIKLPEYAIVASYSDLKEFLLLANHQ